MTVEITAEHLHRFDTLGYFVLPNVVPPTHLELLRCASDKAVAARKRGATVGDEEGVQLMNTRGGRYFIFGLETKETALYGALFGDWAMNIITALTDESNMFHTEFVVKDRDHGDNRTRFGWYQDGGYNTAPNAGGADVPRSPHISIWCALDDMSAANGGLRVLPFDRNPTDQRVKYRSPPRPGAKAQPLFEHRRVTPDTENVNNLSGDIGGYFGTDPGDQIEIAAGGVVVFSALTLHGSGSNTTQTPRRALNIAYTQLAFVDSPEPESIPTRGVPFIENGKLSATAVQLRSAF